MAVLFSHSQLGHVALLLTVFLVLAGKLLYCDSLKVLYCDSLKVPYNHRLSLQGSTVFQVLGRELKFHLQLMSSFPPHVCLSPPPLPLHGSSLPQPPSLTTVPPSRASLPCLAPMPRSHSSLPCFPPIPPSHASLPCLPPMPPSHASFRCLPPMPPFRASLPCLAPMPRSHASTIAGCACNLRSAFNDQGEASGGGRGGRESMERVEHAGVEEASAACGGHS
ncbi:unnamed protein product, partial [Closterium sp. NIES-54]